MTHAGVLSAVAEPMRWHLLELLSDAGEATASSLADRVPISRQAVMKHLEVLRRSGLVTKRASGREIRYTADPEPLAATAAWMAGTAGEWDRRLTALRRLAEAGAADA